MSRRDVAAGALLRVERAALFCALLLVPLAGSTGFSRFEVLKRVVLVVAGAVGLASWVVAFARGGRSRVLGGGLTAGLLWLCLLFTALSALWGPALSLALARLMLWLCLGAVFLMVATRTGGPAFVAAPLALAGLLTAVGVLLNRLGVDLPPPIPTGMAHDAGARGPFDHAAFAGAFLAMTTPLTLYLAAIRGGWLRWASLAAAVVMGVAVGCTGAPAAAVTGLALVVGAMLGTVHLRGQPGSLAVSVATLATLVALVVGRFGLGELPAAPPAEHIPGAARSVFDMYRLDGPENAVTTPEEWGFEWTRGLKAGASSRLLGLGAGSWAHAAALGIDPNHPYYTGPRQERYTHDLPNGLVSGALLELGVVGLVLWMAFLAAIGFSLVRGARHPADSQRAGAGFLVGAGVAALLLALLTPAAYHAGEGVAVFAVLGLLVRLPADRGAPGAFDARVLSASPSPFGRLERWALVAAPVLVLLTAGLIRESRAFMTDLLRQRGELYLSWRNNEDAIVAFQSAVDLNPNDYRSRYDLGLAEYYTPTDAARRNAARDNLQAAAELWPNNVQVRLASLRTDMEAGGLSIDQRMTAAGRVRNELEQLRQMDPAEPDIYKQLADTHRVLGEYDQAANVLMDLTTKTRDPDLLADTHYTIGQIFENDLSQPQQALDAYQQAQATVRAGSPLARNVAQRIRFVQQWIATGTRPDEQGQHHEGEGPLQGLEGVHEAVSPTSTPAGSEGTGQQVAPAPAGSGLGTGP